MSIQKLKSNIEKITNIVHIADIHVRLVKRMDEYKEAFQKLYDGIKETPESTVICVLGDILHNKSDLSAESVQLSSDFLKALADLRPTILISGNHDCLLSNKNRLDSLTPIVNALNHPNLNYLRETGLYSMGNILFNNMSIFDPPEKYIKWKDIPTVHKQSHDCFIALFHGPVHGTKTDLGYEISNKSYPISLFDGHDIALLGDIHKLQDLQLYDSDEGLPYVHYAGSLIMQNHGESITGHGYSVWDVEKVKYDHIEIPNDYGHFTIDIQKGKLNTDLTNIPKKARLRIRCFESVATQVKAVLTKVRKSVDVSDVIYVRVSSVDDTKHSKTSGSILSGDLTNLEYQNKLITAYLKNKLKVVDSKSIENVLKVNSELNSRIKKDEFSRNIRWKPKIFEFDNMFSYGEKNVIDFSKLNGIIGVFAANRAGKSSILSALSFCIFDKCDRAYKASHILNDQKMGFRCKFNFEIDGTDYFIERHGKSDKKGNVPVKVKFWKNENGKDVELHGEGRRDTNEVIRDYIGSYDDFILTTLCLQLSKNNPSFIDMGQSERKDLLSQFIGLTIFDRLYNVSYERAKELGVILREYKNDDFTKKLVELNDSLGNHNNSYRDIQSKITKLSSDYDEINGKILERTKKLINTTSDIVDLEISKKEKKKLMEKIESYENSIKTHAENSSSLKKKIDVYQQTLDILTDKNSEETYKEYLDVENKWKDINGKVETKKVLVRSKLDKLEKLKKHEYDPNCSFCMNNIFVKDAIKTKEELCHEKVEVNELLSHFRLISKKKEELQWSVVEYNNILKNRKLLSSSKDEYNECLTEISKLENAVTMYSTKLNEINKNIQFYHDHQKDIETNKNIQAEIDNLTIESKNITSNQKSSQKEMTDISGRLVLIKSQIEDIKSRVDKAKSMESDYEAYDLYVQCVGRDGIPYEVILVTVPEIENEVNNILGQITDFTIEFESDGKNISPFISCNKSRRPLEMASGWERFISALAIRVALINISNLPRPNMMVIDEGFGCADSDNLSSMSTLFSFLKNQFEFILVISHLDAMKDMVDYQIEIKKEDGLSKLQHT